MKVTTPEISWHERDPIYSVDVQPGSRPVRRLVTGGVDKFVRIWQIKVDAEGKGQVEFLANLKRHTKSVNVCRFSPDGNTLATAGDGNLKSKLNCDSEEIDFMTATMLLDQDHTVLFDNNVIIFWRLSDTPTPTVNIFQEDEEDNRENWLVQKVLRGHLEDIYDLCWSADGKYMITGSVDNTAIMWDLTKDQKLALLNEHKSLVQGVAWDPRNELVATLSTDRFCRIFNVSSKNCVHRVSKMSLPVVKRPEAGDSKDSKPKSFKMFHDDTMRSFFRRLAFSPDGELLVTPAGCVEYIDPKTNSTSVINATFVFSRVSLTKPAVYLPSPEKVTIAVRFCPTLFELKKIPNGHKEGVNKENGLKEWEKYSTLFCLPYRMVFAVATEDSILLYDTQQQQPFGFVSNIHYHQLSDLTWSSDGRTLVASSTDGYCTIVMFEEGELGVQYNASSSPVEASTAEPEAVSSSPKQAQEETGGQDESDIVMETDPSCEDLHLVLDTSTDASDNKDATGSESEGGTFLSPKPVEKVKPSGIMVKSSDGKPKDVKITTLSSTAGSSSGKSASAIGMQVKSKDGTPKRVQITTLSTLPNNSPGSLDEDPRLAALEQKYKHEETDSENKQSAKPVEKTVLSPVVTGNQLTNPKAANSNSSSASAKEKGATVKSSDSKSTPKRVQLTTLSLLNPSK